MLSIGNNTDTVRTYLVLFIDILNMTYKSLSIIAEKSWIISEVFHVRMWVNMTIFYIYFFIEG